MAASLFLPLLPRLPYKAALPATSPPSSNPLSPLPPFSHSTRRAIGASREGLCSGQFFRAAMDAAEVRRSSASSSPEFEFWPLHPNPAASPSCADELFSGGVILPLPVLPPKPASSHAGRSSGGGGGSQGAPAPAPEPEHEAEIGEASILATFATPTASITSPAPPAAAASTGGGSKRWTDIFSKKPAEEKDREKEKRRDGAGGRKQAAHGGGGSGGGGSELNINIWPFSRSRSAGGGSGSSKPRPPARKVSSAPCSRSNSRGEAAAAGPPRRWAASPGRAGGGVPVGRSSPVWQIRRPAARPAPAPSASELPFAERRAPAPAQHREKEKPASAGAGGRKAGLGGGVRGLNLSVNSCIGYRHQVSCRRADVGAARGPGGGGGLFGIKGFFSKKVH